MQRDLWRWLPGETDPPPEFRVPKRREKRMRQTYSQNWPAYNRAQTREGEIFIRLLSDLCKSVEEPKYTFGRPRIPLRDMVFASALKVYSGFSLRRFVSLMRDAARKGCTDTVCSYSTVSNYMRRKGLYEILQKLLQLSTAPLTSIEHYFAVDSTGFGSSRFARYYSFRHQKDTRYHMWVKAHAMCGVKTNVFTAVELSDERGGDSPYFRKLVEKTGEMFEIDEVSADKAYSSRLNYEVVNRHDGKAFIPFKSNATGRSGGSFLWRKMYNYFQYHQEEFLERYHKRSNIESGFHAVKTKFGDSVRSRDKVAQWNEVLLKFLCYNITVVIQEMSEKI